MTKPGPAPDLFLPVFADDPWLICISGPNGAGKSTFYRSHIQPGLPFLNADILAAELGTSPYAAAEMVEHLRNDWIDQKRSFVFETVFSDPVGAKLQILKSAADLGYTVVLCFIGLRSAAMSAERVAMRVLQGGHDVPSDKLEARFPRTLENLRAAIPILPFVLVFDNSDLGEPYRRLATFEGGKAKFVARSLPKWFRPCL